MSIAKRNYVVPLRRKYRNTQRPQRAKKAVTVLREFLAKHMKSEEVRIAKPLNELIWAQGIKNPPSKVAIVAEKNDEGIVYADLEGNKLPSELAEKSDKKAEEKPAKKEDKPAKESTESKSEEKEAKKEDTPAKKKADKKADSEDKPAKKAEKKADTKKDSEDKE